MGGPGSIRETTDLLLEILRLGLARDEDDPLTPEQIQPVSPTAIDEESDTRLSIYLYGVTKEGTLNTGSTHVSGEQKQRPPLGLELRYLLLALPASGAESEKTAVLDQHHLLGLAMQTLYDTTTIEPDRLPEELGDEALTIRLEQREPTELAPVWNTFPELALQPSATYSVSPVRIDSTQSTPFERVSDSEVRVSRGAEADDGTTNESDDGRDG